MANKEINELTAATLPLTGDELVHGVQSANSRKMTVDDIRGPTLKTLADLTLSQGDLFYVNGSGAIVRLAKGTAGQVLYQNTALTAPEWGPAPIGAGQVWHNEFSNRALGTSYQNTHGRPMYASVSFYGGSSNNEFQVSADNTTWITLGASNTGAAVTAINFSAVIPAGWYYRIQRVGGSISVITTWTELY